MLNYKMRYKYLKQFSELLKINNKKMKKNLKQLQLFITKIIIRHFIKYHVNITTFFNPLFDH